MQIVRKRSTLAIVKETTSGVEKKATTANDFVPTLEDFSITMNQEMTQRMFVNGRNLEAQPIPGVRGVEATVPFELTTDKTYSELLTAALGATREVSSDLNITAADKESVTVSNADAAKVKVGDWVVIKPSSGTRYLYKQIKTIASGKLTFAGDEEASNIPTTSKVSKMNVYTLTDSGKRDTFTLGYYQNGKINCAGIGCIPATVAIENIIAGSIPKINFTLQGTDWEERVENAPATPNFDGRATPPVTRLARAFVNEVEVEATEIGLTLNNTVAFPPEVKTDSGKAAPLITGAEAMLTMKIKKDDASNKYFADWQAGTKQDCGFYIPKGANMVGITCKDAVLMTVSMEEADGLEYWTAEFKVTAEAGSGDPLSISIA